MTRHSEKGGLWSSRGNCWLHELLITQFNLTGCRQTTEVVGRGIRNDKSLAPYRDCLGREGPRTVSGANRGSFDRGDLK